jgi:hypothetical protein
MTRRSTTMHARDANTAQRLRILRAKVALALYSENGRVPKEKEIDHMYDLLTRILYQAMLRTHLLCRQQKQGGQVALL